ncbi:hypothetical protein C351_00826 [Cryptococcus neoformans c8]|nr:hypothetical protein C353_00825 [Cryptococcus neoformans var. grubii AD1-83a]OXG68494.1 hypothetical protein C351_00826 [Cryptococcus neoformans var. grubii c8]OXG68603.1 hypothetical protein C354_00828 [Cryptococcus neoformans var. grubii MW-RSA1955]OXG72269.1 hypothetical protein C352_00823 [Cryptococcus neoformans var. grubii CHC193]OXH18280.1 hypothetical protein C369_00823 [Cryptococcus neoformans var. grubii A5-35-17]OXH19963.1 hypothetical protein C370_00817 [Cryptococcus neoformans 
MSSSGVKKRPSSEMEDRNPKRAKHAEAGAGDDDVGVAGEPDLLKGVEKLYSQVVVQAALIFQYMDYSRRIGLKNTKVPVQLQQQLELSWRAYESLRTQIHWDDSKGDRPKALSSTPPLPLPRSVTLATSIPTPAIPPLPAKSSSPASAAATSSLQASKISAQAPLPIPAHLGDAARLQNGPEKTHGPQAQTHAQMGGFSSPIPLGAASSLAFEGQALQEAPVVPPPTLPAATLSSTAIPADGPTVTGGGGAGTDTGTDAGAGAVDFSSLGFNELNQLINGDPTPFGIHLDGTANTSTQINNQSQPQQGRGLGLGLGQVQGQVQAQEKAQGQEGSAQKHADVIDLTTDDDAAGISKPQSQSQLATQTPNQNQNQAEPEPSSLADDVLASLGFSTDLNLTINQDQPPSLPAFTNSQAQNAADGGKATGTLDFGLNTEHDFSALAGLFQGASGTGTPGAGTGVGVGIGLAEGDSNPVSNAATAGAEDTRPVTDVINPGTGTEVGTNTNANANTGATTELGQQGPAKQETLDELFAAADDIISTMRPEDDIPKPESESAPGTTTQIESQAKSQAKPQTQLSNKNQNQIQSQSQNQNQNQNQNLNKNKNKNQTPTSTSTSTSTSASIPTTDPAQNFMLGNIGNIGGMDSMGNLSNNLGGMDNIGGIGNSMDSLGGGGGLDNLDLNLGSMGGMSGMDNFAGMGGMDSNGFGDLGGIDMSDFNFGDAGGDGNGGGAIDTEEFDRLMAEFG